MAMAERTMTALPELHLAGFDGPLDLLLDLAERDVTPVFHPVATRDRRVLSPSSATVATDRDAASLSPAAYAAGVA